jgi:hypothetical protein
LSRAPQYLWRIWSFHSNTEGFPGINGVIGEGLHCESGLTRWGFGGCARVFLI